MKKSIFANLTLEQQEQWRKFSSRGGKSGSHAAKVRAGKLGMAARLAKERAKGNGQ